MICTVQIIKTIICEHHHPALKALQQNKVLDEIQWNPAVSLDEHLYKTNGSFVPTKSSDISVLISKPD